MQTYEYEISEDWLSHWRMNGWEMEGRKEELMMGGLNEWRTNTRAASWMDGVKCNIPRVSPSWFYCPNNISWAVQISKLLILYSFLLLCYLIPRRPKFLHLHLFSNILSVRHQVSHLQNNRENYKSLYFNIYMLILIFMCWVANRKTDCVELWQAFPELILLLISSLI